MVITIAFCYFLKDRHGGSAGEVLSLVYQSLLHNVISRQNHTTLRTDVHSHHWAMTLTELKNKSEALQG